MRVKCRCGYLSILDRAKQMDFVRKVVHFSCYTVSPEKEIKNYSKKKCFLFSYKKD